jgi:hypothetical protein
MTLKEKIREYAESNRPFRLPLSDTRILEEQGARELIPERECHEFVTLPKWISQSFRQRFSLLAMDCPPSPALVAKIQ